VSLVHHYRAVVVEVTVVQRLTQKEAISHVLNDAVGARAILKADGVADEAFSKRCLHFFGNTLSHGYSSYTTRLSAANDAIVGVPAFIEVLRQLRSFSTTCFTDNDYDPIVTNRSQQLLSHAKHWQVLALLLQCFAASKFTDSLLLFGDSVGIPVVGFVIDIFARRDGLSWDDYSIFTLFSKSYIGSWPVVAHLLDGLSRDFFVVRHDRSHFCAG